MNKLLNLYGVKIHSERAFLSFLENSRNEVEAFSSSYIEEGWKSCFFYSGRQGFDRIESSYSFSTIFRKLARIGI